MATEWQECRWGDLATLEYGKGLRGYENATGRFRVFGTNGPIGWHTKPLCNYPSVIIGRKGAYRGVHYSPAPFYVIDTAFYLEPKTNFDTRWAYYELLTHDINGMDSGSAIPSTSRDAFYNLPVLLPPLPEQRAIAHILGTLDDKIELNRRTDETLEAMARALFTSWFVDFDPVRARAEGRQPAGMDAETAALFPDGFEDSPLGEIPRGWRVGKLGDVVKINARSIARDYAHAEIQYIDISSVSEGRLEGTTPFTLADAPSRARRLVEHGDTIWSTVRPNRKSYLFIHNPADNLVVSTGFAVLTPCSIPPSYLYAWTTTDEFVDYLAYNADGSAYPAVLPNRFADALVLLPPAQLLQRYEQQVGPIRNLISQNELGSRTLASIRDALLPKLLSGEVRVGKAETMLATSVL